MRDKIWEGSLEKWDKYMQQSLPQATPISLSVATVYTCPCKDEEESLCVKLWSAFRRCDSITPSLKDIGRYSNSLSLCGRYWNLRNK